MSIRSSQATKIWRDWSGTVLMRIKSSIEFGKAKYVIELTVRFPEMESFQMFPNPGSKRPAALYVLIVQIVDSLLQVDRYKL